MPEHKMPASIDGGGRSGGVQIGSELRQSKPDGPPRASQLLTARQVAAKLAVSRPQIYALMRAHGFPQPLKLGGRRAWVESEVDAWLAARAEARNG